MLSLVAVIGQMVYAFLLSNTLEVMGPGSAILPSAIIVIAAALVWFSTRAKVKGWTG
jgi:hypothetical protein